MLSRFRSLSRLGFILTSRFPLRIQNPLHGIPKAKLLAQVEEFTREKGLEEHTLLFQKGALIAQNPSKFEELEELDEADKAIIRRETTRRPHFSSPLSTRLIIICRQMGPTQISVYDRHHLLSLRCCPVRVSNLPNLFFMLTIHRLLQGMGSNWLQRR